MFLNGCVTSRMSKLVWEDDLYEGLRFFQPEAVTMQCREGPLTALLDKYTVNERIDSFATHFVVADSDPED